jgi:negative regulator of sigma E activity
MHARIEHLLSIRDGEPVAANVAEHVKVCSACSGELRRLQSLRTQMQSLPQFEPPAMAWERISQTIPQRRRGWGLSRVGLAAACAAAITLAVIAFVTSYSDRRDTGAPTVQLVPPQAAEPEAGPTLDELVAQSQELERLLRSLPHRPRIERVSTAATIDTIEQRIQWLDFQLSTAPAGDLSEAQSRRLWRERVELMDSLVKVRYAEAGDLWF